MRSSGRTGRFARFTAHSNRHRFGEPSFDLGVARLLGALLVRLVRVPVLLSVLPDVRSSHS